MAQFTPGPWRFGDPEDTWSFGDGIEITCDGRKDLVPIACVETGFDELFESEQLANARLIAAAPEMYQLLQELACLVRAHTGPNDTIAAPILAEYSALISRIDGAA